MRSTQRFRRCSRSRIRIGRFACPDNVRMIKEIQGKIPMPAVSKTERIDVRVSPAAKDTLQMAASQVNKTVSQFLLDAGLTAAAETLEDRRSFSLDKRRWNAFLKILDRPPRVKRRLARLLAERSALE
jgi:uncharacterized protein (DUF1778 family)